MKLRLVRRFDYEQSLNIFSIAALGTVLVLFYILFATTTFHRETEPARPFVRHVQELPASERDLVVRIYRNGQIVLGRQYVSDAEVSQRLAEIQETTPDRSLFLEADKEVPYAKIEFVIRSAREAGFEELNLVMGPRDVLEGLQRRQELPAPPSDSP